MTIEAGWRTAWVTALDELESDVEAVEALLLADQRQRETPPFDPWTPPEGMGPLPLDLVPRADRILTRQIAAADAVARSMSMNRRQSKMTSRIEVGSDGGARPAYLDCAM
jgi:hypothetical protein